MEICVLGSSSAGNCTLVKTENTTLLVDVGFSLRYTETALSQIGVDPHEVDAVLISHEHTDHIRGIGPFSRKYKVPFLMNKRTYQRIEENIVPALFTNFQEFRVKELRITPVCTNHDSSDPVAYLIKGDRDIGMATDLGSVDSRLLSYFKHLDVYIFESNHDREMLWNGRYPEFLKNRIASDHGHLSNTQCGSALNEMCNNAEVFLAHISENNNTPKKAKNTVESMLNDEIRIHLTYPSKVSAKVTI